MKILITHVFTITIALQSLWYEFYSLLKHEDNDYGIDCGDVCQAAYVALREWVDEELDITKLIEDKMENIK